MDTVQLKTFKIIGITVRTTNENGQAAADIPALWQRFMSEGIVAQIPNKISNDVYSIYTNYESDYTKPYDIILGCRVDANTEAPNGMVSQTFADSAYAKFVTKGNLNDNIVYNKWAEIWNMDLKRKYIADFEIYGEKAQNPQDAEVSIFIGIEK